MPSVFGQAPIISERQKESIDSLENHLFGYGFSFMAFLTNQVLPDVCCDGSLIGTIQGMRILLQKVKNASVSVDGKPVGEIGRGYLLFLGILHDDAEAQAEWLAEKILGLRLFDADDGPPGPDGSIRAGKINDRSIADIKGEMLIVSQFTLAGDVSKGNRPDYTAAAGREEAKRLYQYFIDSMNKSGLKVETGEFGAMMDVSLVNDGPVTLVIERG